MLNVHVLVLVLVLGGHPALQNAPSHAHVVTPSTGLPLHQPHTSKFRRALLHADMSLHEKICDGKINSLAASRSAILSQGSCNFSKFDDGARQPRRCPRNRCLGSARVMLL
jgi:hypothetical protein